MEEITLEKIDIIRGRTGLSYREAKEALERNQGILLDTLI
jgi:NACalpha-BTF3-like transcription factor